MVSFVLVVIIIAAIIIVKCLLPHKGMIWYNDHNIFMKAPSITTTISAAFLVGGTCIGGGMLALPVATGISGFWPSTLFMLICWAAMTLTGLLFLEVTLWMEEGVHIISMTSRILGPIGKAIAWLLYLFICYASLVAYAAGGGLQIVSAFQSLLGLSLPQELGCVLFTVVFGAVIYLGNQIVGRVNSLLFIAMCMAYLALVGMGLNEVKPHLLLHSHWNSAWLAVPIFLTSFSFQTMVPSLVPYLKRHAPSCRFAVICGTTIALAVYLIWQWLILGIVPVEGANGLEEALRRGVPATQFINEHVQGSTFSVIAEYFAFFAIITSFLGIALGLYDFLSDGLRIKEKGSGKIALALLIALPTIFFATQFERVFFLALEYTGGYGDAILNGLIPVLLVWVGHYHLGYASEQKSWLFNRTLLAFVFLFYTAVLLFKTSLDFGIFSL